MPQTTTPALHRIELDDPESLSSLRRHTFKGVGFNSARGVLYALGMAEGWVNGYGVRQGFDETGEAAPRFSGPSMPVLFSPDRCDLSRGFTGRLDKSPEAALHLDDFGETDEVVCYVSAGYAAGWFSALLDQRMIVVETHCQARGDKHCRFEARSRQDWAENPRPELSIVAPCLDFDATEERAVAQVNPNSNAGGPMLGQFDPLSPAAHIWGPVMILPYSGGDDSEDALDSLLHDIGAGQIRVALIDLTGASLSPLEASGLARLLERTNELEIEPILVGLDARDTMPFGNDANELNTPLTASDVFEGIAIAFQMSLAPRDAH